MKKSFLLLAAALVVFGASHVSFAAEGDSAEVVEEAESPSAEVVEEAEVAAPVDEVLEEAGDEGTTDEEAVTGEEAGDDAAPVEEATETEEAEAGE